MCPNRYQPALRHGAAYGFDEARTDPTARNVYLNPRRADQVLVHKNCGAWEVLPLAEATRLIFDGVAQGILTVSRNYEERQKLPLEAQNALSMALASTCLLYDDLTRGIRTAGQGADDIASRERSTG